MNNLEAKEEAIKSAYGEYWETVKHFVDGNGWCCSRRNVGFEEIVSKLSWETKRGNSYLWRPKSLQGIENNNGWIKIESEDDLPKDINQYWFKGINGKIEIRFFNPDWINDMIQFKLRYTHYQPIEKPKLPIY